MMSHMSDLGVLLHQAELRVVVLNLSHCCLEGDLPLLDYHVELSLVLHQKL